jgi:hypothetical protein
MMKKTCERYQNIASMPIVVLNPSPDSGATLQHKEHKDMEIKRVRRLEILRLEVASYR